MGGQVLVDTRLWASFSKRFEHRIAQLERRWLLRVSHRHGFRVGPANAGSSEGGFGVDVDRATVVQDADIGRGVSTRVPSECTPDDVERAVEVVDTAAATRTVSRQGAVRDAQRAAVVVIDTTARGNGTVPRQGAVRDAQGAAVADDSAAGISRAVPRQRAVRYAQRAVVVVDTAAVTGSVPRQSAVRDAQRAQVVDTAAQGTGAVLNGEPLDGGRESTTDTEHCRGVIPVNRQRGGARPVDGEVGSDVNGARRQRDDRAGRAEDHHVPRTGTGHRGAKRPSPRVGALGDVHGRGGASVAAPAT